MSTCDVDGVIVSCKTTQNQQSVHFYSLFKASKYKKNRHEEPSPGDSPLELPAEGDVDEEVDAAVDDEAEVTGGKQHVEPVGELGTHCQGVLGGKAAADVKAKTELDVSELKPKELDFFI